MQRKLTKKQKCYHFICFPIMSFISFYLLISLLSYLFKGRLLTSSEDVIYMLAGAIGFSIMHWIDLVYPPRPRKDPNKRKKGLKEYIQQYVIEGSPFNKIIIMIYIISVSLVIVIVWLTIIGYF